VKERPVQFGTGTPLIGVLTEPAPGDAAAGRPGVLMLNSGILHRVGSCRLHVRLARALAAAGYTSLRFDYSGIGDSEPRRDNLPFEASAVAETREAMDYLAARKGLDGFVLLGLCSGADMAHETAVADARVRALVLLDAWAYRNLGYYWHHYAPRLLRPAVWANYGRVRLQRLARRRVAVGAPVSSDGVEYEMPKYVRVFPPRERIAKDLRLFMSRDMQLFLLWTGGLWVYNHRGQYTATFRRELVAGNVREEYLPDADHILTGLDHQAWVTREVVSWLEALPRRAAVTAAARGAPAEPAPSLSPGAA